MGPNSLDTCVSSQQSRQVRVVRSTGVDQTRFVFLANKASFGAVVA